MYLKRASTLVITYEPQGIVVHNFLNKRSFECNTQCIAFLNNLPDWKSLDIVYSNLRNHFNHKVTVENINKLLDIEAIIVKGSEASIHDDNYNKHWDWGTTAGFYHFTIRNTRFLAEEKQRQAIRQRRLEKEEPSAIKRNSDSVKIVQLPEFKDNNHLFSTMRKRRSKREYQNKPVGIRALADCLYAAKGVEQWVKDEDFGHLPLTMTPSGGARNPYELYVYAKDITDLQPGFYHYSGEQHNLEQISSEIIDLPELLAHQKWTSTAAAAIFLIANFERSSWKYHLAPAYRIVLMEAGFIGQNIALTATHHGLSAVPTGAVSENLIEKYLQTTPVKEAHILSLVIGNPV